MKHIKRGLCVLMAMFTIAAGGCSFGNEAVVVPKDEKKEENPVTVQTGTTEKPEGIIRIMSYNCLTTTKAGVEYATGKKGYSRGHYLVDFLGEKLPDSVGIQEITVEWRDYIDQNLVTFPYDNGVLYFMVGLENEKGDALTSGATEYSPILYRRDLYEVEKYDGGWLSDTPDVPSKYESIVDDEGKTHLDMKFKRVYCYAVFKDRKTGEVKYAHVNTHFDHVSDDYINEKCSKVICDVVKKISDEYGCPVFVTGDFNSGENTEAYKYLANGEHGLTNSKYMTDDHSEKGTCPGYWQDYSEYFNPDPIDHVFVNGKNVSCVKHDIISNKYFSDHSAVVSDFIFN